MSKRKPIIAMDISTTGKGGGPYSSTINIVNSSLREKYDYRLFEYNSSLGRSISIKRIRHIVKQLKEIQPDIVQFSGLQLQGFHIALACRIVGIKKTILVIHGSSLEALDISKIKKAVLYLLEILTIRLSSTFYGVSIYSSNLKVTNFFKNKSSGYVYNLPGNSFNNAETAYTREDLEFKENDIIIVSVGRITKDKGYHILAESIKNLYEENELKFLIIGEGDYIEEMKNSLLDNIAEGSVKFLGYRNDVNDILPFCDIFVLPTLHETLSIALLEASANKLPLIASNVGGVPEIIKNGENGFLVPPSDTSALKDAILKLAYNKQLREKMGEEAKFKLETKFSEVSIVSKIDSIYQELLNK